MKYVESFINKMLSYQFSTTMRIIRDCRIKSCKNPTKRMKKQVQPRLATTPRMVLWVNSRYHLYACFFFCVMLICCVTHLNAKEHVAVSYSGCKDSKCSSNRMICRSNGGDVSSTRLRQNRVLFIGILFTRLGSSFLKNSFHGFKYHTPNEIIQKTR